MKELKIMTLANKLIVEAIALTASLGTVKIIYNKIDDLKHDLEQSETYQDGIDAIEEFANGCDEAKEYYYSKINYNEK